MPRPTAIRDAPARRLHAEGGQTSSEYVGILLLVALVVAAAW